MNIRQAYKKKKSGPHPKCKKKGCDLPAAESQVYCSKDHSPFGNLVDPHTKAWYHAKRETLRQKERLKEKKKKY